jgi:hypothetical protein
MERNDFEEQKTRRYDISFVGLSHDTIPSHDGGINKKTRGTIP